MENITGKRIKELRIGKNMTQEELGKRLGVQKSVVAKYESGKVVNMKRDIIEKLSIIFNVRPAYICGYTDTSEDNKYSELIGVLDDLNAEGVEMVFRYAEFILSQSIYKKCNSIAVGEE